MNTSTTVDGNEASPSQLPSASWTSRCRATRLYDLAIRVLGSAWFLILALVSAGQVLAQAHAMGLADFGPTGWPALLSSVCLLLFYLALGWLILHRPSPVALESGILPSLVAFAGTYLPWAIVLFVPGYASAGQNIVSTALLVVGTVSMVPVVGYLGRSFSIVPQARRLVRTGPYAVVRNPLYLVEEIAMLGLLLHFFSIVTLLLFLAHGALQVGRILYEEDLLRRTFPDYDEYARSTARLIPCIW